jgi:hypothetical protein
VVEVADLRGVPFFMKGSVKKKFPADRSQWVLMDWKGELATTFEFESATCSILLFDWNGILRLHVAVQELDQDLLGQILDAIDTLIVE